MSLREVLKHVTSRWGVLILVALRDGTHRFSDLRRKMGGVSEKMLAQSLQALEQAGVSREDCAGVGMGCPGTVNAETGEVIYSNNFANWEYLPLGSYLTESLACR